MKLHTSIPPRRDGTVKVKTPAGSDYVFVADAEGELACEVADEADLTWMLKTQHFYPAEAADTSAAVELVKAAQAEEEGDEDAEDEEEDDDGAEVVNGGLPVEANTPPVPPKRPGRPRKTPQA